MRSVLIGLPAAASALEKQPPGKKHPREVQAILIGLSLEGDEGARAWRDYVDQDGWWKTAHRDDLRTPRRHDAAFAERFSRFVRVVHVVLDAVERQYGRVLDRVEELLTKPRPDAESLETLTKYLGSGVVALWVVFEKVGADWLVPLRERGVFRDPPRPIVYDDGSYSFPSWPQALYLKRIASEAPEAVTQTIEGIAETENDAIHLSFLATAARLPPPFAGRLAVREARWLEQHPWRHGLLVDNVLRVCEHLVKNGETAAALELTRVTLGFPESADRPDTAFGPHPRFPDWTYDEFASSAVPLLVRADPEATRALLLNLLDGAARRASKFWRGAVEEHAQNLVKGPLDTLLGALRDLYEQQIATGMLDLRVAVEELERREPIIFQRLALHLLRRFRESSHDLVSARLTRQSLLDTRPAFHELAELLAAVFPEASGAEQARILEALHANASLERITAENSSSDLSADDLARRADAQKLQWYAVLGANLPSQLQTAYEGLRESYGTLEHPTFHAWVTHGTFGSGAPALSSTALRELNDDALVLRILEEPPKTPAWEGLAHEVYIAATEDPARFSRLLGRLIQAGPSYISETLRGIHQALRADRSVAQSIEWSSVLELAESSLASSPSGDSDTRWQRQSVAEILADAPLSASAEQARRAWRVLVALLGDPDPDPPRLTAEASTESEIPFNSVRGIALHSAVVFLGAVMNRDDLREALVPTIFSEFERRCRSAIEPADSIRAIMLRHLSYLLSVDQDRARVIAEQILAESDKNPSTAWRALLGWNRASGPLYEALNNAYREIAGRAAELDDETAGLLGNHLLALEVWGILRPDTPGGPIEMFRHKASVRARRHALSELGRDLQKAESSLPSRAVENLKYLIEWWLDSSTASSDNSDLTAFGWWFSGAVFDATWSLQTLHRVLERTDGRIEWEEEVLERLGRLADRHPNEVAGCLGPLVQADGPGVRMYEKAIRSVVEALRSTPAIEEARGIASRLVSRGFLSFRDLI
jgi:hypothetical protein